MRIVALSSLNAKVGIVGTCLSVMKGAWKPVSGQFLPLMRGKLNPAFGAASSADFKAYKMLIDLHLFS